MARAYLALSVAMIFAAPVAAQERAAVEMLIGNIAPTDDAQQVEISLRVLNGGDTARDLRLPARMRAQIARGSQVETLWLERAATTAETIRVAPHGFAAAHYRAQLSGTADGQPLLLSIPEWNTPAFAVKLAPQTPFAPPMIESAHLPPEAETVDTPRKRANNFLGNLDMHEPVYAVYGPGTNSDARLQLSFKYKLFGGRPDSWLGNLYFAYTQRMFWDLGAHSSPFRNLDFQPEIMYETPSVRLGENIVIAARAGLRHESNGRDGASSRSHNQLYIQPLATWSFNDGYFLKVGPRLWVYTGSRSDNRDISHYRGNSGLTVQAGKEDGLQLSATSRLNFGSGKGALGIDLSYPLPALWSSGPDFYIYGQSFIGYGENLLDYNRRTNRLRIGIAVVR